MRYRAVMLCASLALPLVHASAASAQTPPTAANRSRARENFMVGVAAYERGDFSVALEAFQTAYRLAPHPTVRVNIANCYVQLHQPLEALTYFDSFLAESTAVAPAQRQEIEGQMQQLRLQVAEVRLHLSPTTSASVLLDGHSSPSVDVLRMNPGHHVLEITSDGFAPIHQELNVSGGEQSELSLTLRVPGAAVAAVTAPVPTPVAPPTEPPVAAPPATPPPVAIAPMEPLVPAPMPPPVEGADRGGARHGLVPTYFYAGAVATGVFLVGWVTFGGLAVGANNTFNDAVSMVNQGIDVANQTQRGHDAASQARTFAAVSDVGLALTVVAGVASAILFTQTDFHGSRVTVSPIVGRDGSAGLALGGSF